MIDVQQQQQHRHINDNNNNLKFSNNNNNNNNLVANVSDILISSTNDPKFQSDQMETFEVELIKDQQGLGITIAGYVCEKGMYIEKFFFLYFQFKVIIMTVDYLIFFFFILFCFVLL